MKEILGTTKRYVITQNVEGVEEVKFVEYDNYTGSFYAVEGLNMATRFDSKEQAVELADLQNRISELLGRAFTHAVIEEVITYTEVEPEVLP